jgi:hypothetical protein
VRRGIMRGVDGSGDQDGEEGSGVSNTAWFIYAGVGALVSLVGLSVAVALKDWWVALVAAVALVAFSAAAVLFGRAVF